MTTTNTFPAAILFDHDGTLVDTEPVWAAAKVALTAEFGGTWTEQDTLDCLGLSMQFTLDRLRERGVNLPNEEINDRLVAKVREALAQQGTFSVVIGNDETTNPKPDPQPYLLAAERLDVDPTQCVALEDSPSGVRSATAAGMRVIVVPGELEVPAELGTARLKHEELTLEAVRALA